MRRPVQLVTAPEMAPDLERFFGYQATQRLSPAALETLAIIAYRQPVTRPQIEAIRGVDCSGVLNTMLARGLVAEVGRLETAGHPILYGTTPAFLRHFGLPPWPIPPADLDAPAAEGTWPEGCQHQPEGARSRGHTFTSPPRSAGGHRPG